MKAGQAHPQSAASPGQGAWQPAAARTAEPDIHFTSPSTSYTVILFIYLLNELLSLLAVKEVHTEGMGW